jgi:hypothetical protein
MAAPSTFFTEDFGLQLDDLLYEICEELQLSSSRYKQAVERYEALSQALEAVHSPFRLQRPLIYPQGSMRLGTTVILWRDRMIWISCCNSQGRTMKLNL